MVEPPPSSPVTEADRQEAISRLRQSYMDGRLSLAEYEARADKVIDASSQTTLEQALGDVTARGSGKLPARESEDVVRRALSGILSEQKLVGQWDVTPEVAAVAILGQVTIDLREAVFLADETEIHVVAILGTVKVIVPPGVNVHVNVDSVLAEVSQKKLPAYQTGAPLVTITGYAFLGEVSVLGKKPKELSR